MKNIKNILVLMLAVFAVSCIEKEPEYQDFPAKDVDFTFAVQGDEYTTDFYYVSPIQFTNTSAKTGAVTWYFGDGTTSNDTNPVHQYAKADKYDVTLEIEGVGSRTYPLQVMDIAPVMSITSQSEDTVTINQTVVNLDIEIPNPNNLKCEYTWIFPAGTTLEDGTAIEKFVGYSNPDGTIDNPGGLKFKNIGSNKIELQTKFDVPTEERPEGENRPLSASYVNIQVGASVEAPTLYYASYGGNVKAYKLIPAALLPEGTENLPFDMGVSSGVTPQELVFASTKDGDFIYILDCGKNFIYQNDVDGVLGDGKITVMSADGTYANLVITNVGGHAFADPFHGCVYGDNLLYTDRNCGISTIALSARGQVEKRVPDDGSYMVMNNGLGFYGKGIAYGAVHSAIAVDNNDVFYWPKSYKANGLFRFRQSDIGKTDDVPCPVILSGASPKAFALDTDRAHMYVWHTSGDATGKEGFHQYPLVAFEAELKNTEFTKQVAMDATETAGSSVEALHVSQFAVDPGTGNVYFGFNPDATGETTRKTAGIYYYDYTAGDVTKAPIVGTENEKVFGICINPRKTKLF